jgi:hypothetical protein
MELTERLMKVWKDILIAAFKASAPRTYVLAKDNTKVIGDQTNEVITIQNLLPMIILISSTMILPMTRSMGLLYYSP